VETERIKAIVRAFVEAINVQDWDRLDDLVAPAFVRHSHAAGLPAIRSRDDLKSFLRGEFATFPDAHEALEDLLAEGDKVAARHRFRGTQHGPMGPYSPSGRVMAVDYLAIYRVEGDRIAEAWVEWDNLSGLIQLGHYYPSAEPNAAATGGRDPGFSELRSRHAPS
jgi:predicted ester cyclase